MTPDRWKQIREVLEQALDLAPGERSAFLEQAYSSDPSLRQEVETLLASSPDERSSFLQSSPQFVPHEIPASIGRYRILRLLGEGGMGAVYEAEQEQPRRNVALKVIKAAWASPELLRRFEREFQTLGRLHHPGIAQIYEAGAADTGFGLQPFFAMELIHGKPLTEYATAESLNTRQRLALMIQICEAVQHAHQSSIIHRDLKPGNILIEESGQPKVLDFGVARVTDNEATRQTDIGQLVGTLPYMSPEQVTGDPLALDTRSDVYALGVILYELLAGKLPYQLSHQLYEAVQTIQHVDAAPLSSVDRSYRGDIETIVAKALEKDKDRRYASAADLAADIQRYLDDKPLAAKPASASYQLKKFARRHRALVAGLAAVFLVLAGGIVASTWEAVRARRAEARAQQEAASAQAVNDFLQNDLLAQAGAYGQSTLGSKLDPDLKVRTALDRAAHNIEGKFKNQPEVEASIRYTIAESYFELGLRSEAQTQAERALRLRERTLGLEHPKTLQTMTLLSGIDFDQAKYSEAEVLLTRALDLQGRTLGPEHPDTLHSMSVLASVYMMQGKYSQAVELGSQTFNAQRRVLGSEKRETLRTMASLAEFYRLDGKYAEALVLAKESFEISRRVLGPDSPDTLQAFTDLSSAYGSFGNYEQAEALAKQGLDGHRRVYGLEHPLTLISMINLARAYELNGKYAESEALASDGLEKIRRIMGREHPVTLYAMDNLASAELGEGKYSDALTIFRQILEIRQRINGPENVQTLAACGLSGHFQPQQAEPCDGTNSIPEWVSGARNG